MAFFFVAEVGHLVGTCQKAGSCSLANFYHRPNLRQLTLEAAELMVESGWRVTALIRNPFDRFESAYNFFQYGTYAHFPTERDPVDINDFAQMILSGVNNPHWLPQVPQFGGLPTKWLRLEDQAWKIENSVEHTEKLANYDLLFKYYKEDLDKWQSLESTAIQVMGLMRETQLTTIN